MELFFCILLGYLLGTLSPAAILAFVKQINLKEQGTGNLGATNTFMVIGRGYGIMVMLLDITKAFLAVKLAGYLFPRAMLGGLVSGISAVLGHVFPFYMKFKGGKGLAAYAGLILAFDGWIFLALLIICMTCMLIVNYAVALPMSAAVLFPIFAALRYKNLLIFLLTLAVSILIIVKNWSNLRKAMNGEVVKFREYFNKTA